MTEGPRAEKQAVGVQFQQFVKVFNGIVENNPPEKWWLLIMVHLKRAERSLEKLPEEMRAFLADTLEEVQDILIEEAKVQIPDGNSADTFRGERSREVIHQIADVLGKLDSSREVEPPVLREVTMEEILRDTEHFAMGDYYAPMRNVKPGDMVLKATGDIYTFTEEKFSANDPGMGGESTPRSLRIRASSNDPWHDFPLPVTENMLHKGGLPRLVLKILAGAPIESIKTELPPNDFDVLAIGDPTQRYAEAAKMGVDIAGVEMVPSFDEDEIGTIMNARDMDFNMCLLGKNRFIFTDEAVQAAKTGHIALKAEDRGIYGSENLYFKGEKLAKNRGMFRLMKFVAEGKALSFDYKPLNEQIGIGIYWLVLARKFARKENGGMLLNRLFELGKRMNQVPEGMTDIYDMLNAVHTKNDFFDFEDKDLDEVGLAQWMNRKLSKYAHKIFKARHKIPSDLEMTRTKDDTIPRRISLERYVDDPAADAATKLRWEQFLADCRARNNAYKEAERTAA